MVTDILSTELSVPPSRPEVVPRPRLIERPCAGLDQRATLISALAGLGKTTLRSERVASGWRRVAGISLGQGGSNLACRLAYVTAALQTIEGNVGQVLSAAIRSPAPANVETGLTTLINELASLPSDLGLGPEPKLVWMVIQADNGDLVDGGAAQRPQRPAAQGAIGKSARRGASIRAHHDTTYIDHDVKYVAPVAQPFVWPSVLLAIRRHPPDGAGPGSVRPIVLPRDSGPYRALGR